MWVENDIMYMGYYNGGGARSSTSRVNCAAICTARAAKSRGCGRAIRRDIRPNAPFCWGAQPHNGLIYFNDINSGLWITKLSR